MSEKSHYKLLDTRQMSELGKTTLSFILLFISIGIYSIGAIIAMTPVEQINTAVIKGENVKRCTDIMQGSGYRVENNNGNLTIKSYNLLNYKEEFFGLENGIARCDGYVLQNLCYGITPHCQEQGLTATLRYVDPIVYKK